jgi:hypothetical protein
MALSDEFVKESRVATKNFVVGPWGFAFETQQFNSFVWALQGRKPFAHLDDGYTG